MKDNQEAIRKAMHDNYQPVAVTAAAIAYDRFGDEKAENYSKASANRRTFTFH
jgi:hypothetical protein